MASGYASILAIGGFTYRSGSPDYLVAFLPRGCPGPARLPQLGSFGPPRGRRSAPRSPATYYGRSGSRRGWWTYRTVRSPTIASGLSSPGPDPQVRPVTVPMVGYTRHP